MKILFNVFYDDLMKNMDNECINDILQIQKSYFLQ